MEPVLKTDVYPRLRLRCSGTRAEGKRHTFYLPGVKQRIGQMRQDLDLPVSVKCPVCGEKVAGGVVEPIAGYQLWHKELTEVE